MTITYEWSIGELERYTESGGVITAHYRCVGTNEATGTSDSNYGSIHFTPDPDSENFIPFESLTEDIVLGWVKSQPDPDKENLGLSIESSIAKKNDSIDNPVSTKGVPWSSD